MNNFLGGGLGFSSNVLASAFAPGSARNGLSVDPTGHIVLGDPLATPGPADLLDDRIIDMQGFTFRQFHHNQAGFDNWAFTQEDNFMYMRDEVTQKKVIYWTVDFSGNTGQFIGNDRTEPGWVAPFILMSDTGTGLFGRLIFNANNAMELTDSNPSNALALFLSGNAAVQPAGAADPGYKFTVNGAGNAQVMQVLVGTQFLNLDALNLLYQYGDIGGTNFGLHLSLNDNTGIADFSNTALNAVLSVNGNPGITGTFDVSVTPNVTVEGGIITSIT